MKGKRGEVHIGTSGFSYKHWLHRFYPERISMDELLDFYTLNFDTVELNNTFYQLPKEETFDHWKEAVPDNFSYSVKASRLITHYKRLQDADEYLDNFLSRVYHLKNKIGPVLFQLPPSFKVEIDVLQNFVSKLPDDLRYTFEFRNKSWYTEEVYDVLRKYNIAFCIYELNYHQTPIITTSDFVYIRLHGPETKYAGSYSEKSLYEWKDRIEKWTEEGKDVYCYFDNDQYAYAAFNASSLMEIVGS